MSQMPDKKQRKNLRSKPFTVDAALLRELGERLIGRAHIALAELVKNSYDADAHTCRIEFEDDRIVITDDGHGMSRDEFLNYWMRIGTTHKADARSSRDLDRPMTGSKGLGRLSVQFLAEEMELESNCKENPEKMVYAIVDWKNIRSGEELHTVEVEWDDPSETSIYADGSPFGTRITLTGLKSLWDGEALEKLGSDVWMLRSPFRDGRGKTKGKTALDFHIDLQASEIESARERFNKRHNALFDNWKARITGVVEDARQRSGGSEASVTVEFAPDYPEGVGDARTYRETVRFPVVRRPAKTDDGDDSAEESDEAAKGSDKGILMDDSVNVPALNRARFSILVFKTEGRQPGGLSVGEMREYLKAHGGVSVYDAGFRLPYYGSEDLSGHDWLNVGVDQGRRLITSELLPERLRTGTRYLLDLPNPGRIFGAVDVDTNHEAAVADKLPVRSDWLRIQPGRDRLAPNSSFAQLRDLVRFGLDFYANRYRAVSDDVAQKQRGKERPSRVLDNALLTLDSYKTEIPKVAYQDVRRDVVAVRTAVEKESKAIDSRATLLAPLATAGMAALAMNHELSNNATLLEEVLSLLRELAESAPSVETERAVRALEEYQAQFDAFRGLISPLADREDREATRRHKVETIVSQVVGILQRRLSGVVFDYNSIPRDLLFPVGAFVEWSAIIQNLLFNAWNAMLDCKIRIVRFDGSPTNVRRQYLRISDTGVGLTMPPEEAGILFEAFERRISIGSQNQSIAIGGQGLGLAIVRMIANSRSADVSFVNPPEGFSTAIQISWKG
ncbi:MAG: hypothetical protein F4030_13180 [Gammaproteobacteria bacterium]|nr:hypothetical protein [Gammaproteobacteria bacterium]MYH86234.1 hypothetical protein [Gammaproteobacteria bacterium]MYK05928.1 hypothetical protein [Gammaproteobacteria bacterium]